jgi:hypothetical protein
VILLLRNADASAIVSLFCQCSCEQARMKIGISMLLAHHQQWH